MILAIKMTDLKLNYLLQDWSQQGLIHGIRQSKIKKNNKNKKCNCDRISGQACGG